MRVGFYSVRSFITVMVVFLMALLFCVVSGPVIAASSTTQETLSYEASSSEKECQISKAAQDAIDRTTDAAIKGGKISVEALDLVDKAEAIAGPPECDSERAIELAEWSVDLANAKFQVNDTKKLSDSTKTSYGFDNKNSLFIEGGFRMGTEKVRISEQNCVDIFFQATDCPRGFRIGEGAHLAIGFNYFIGDNRSKSLSIAAGFLEGGGTDESSSAKTLEIVFTQYYGLHRLGIGLSYHVDPDYEEEIDAGYGDTADNRQLNFDDALGIVFKYGYLVRSPDWELGCRFTLMDYELASEDYNASSLGIFASKSFM